MLSNLSAVKQIATAMQTDTVRSGWLIFWLEAKQTQFKGLVFYQYWSKAYNEGVQKYRLWEVIKIMLWNDKSLQHKNS